MQTCKLFTCHLITGLLFGGALASEAGAQIHSWDQLRIIVEFQNRTQMGDIDSLLGGNGFVAEKSLRDSATYLVRIPKEWTVEEAIENVSRREPVAYAGANQYCRLPEAAQMSQAFLDAGSDPYSPGVSPGEYYTQYAMTTLAIPSGLQMAMGDGQLIAQIDNGVDFLHPALLGHLSELGYDFVDSDIDPGYESGDFDGHGTFSAGLLALGAPHAMILPIRALDGDGRGTVFDICLGVEYAVTMQPAVMCLGFSLSVDDRIMRTTLQRADSAGMIVVAPAGNDSSEIPAYPAAYSFVVGVGATDSVDVKATYSNWGASVDVCAPGVDIYSALPGGDTWGWWNGTSFSAPLTAALVALVRELHPAAPSDACVEIIKWGSEPIDTLNAPYMGLLGDGRIDYARATGHTAPVLALWGIVTDSSGAGHPGVVIEVSQGGATVPRSSAETDSTGAYCTATLAGITDITFVPPSISGHETVAQSGLELWNDTAISAVLPDVRRGDINLDGMWNVQDVVGMIEYVFRGDFPPEPLSLADFSCDSVADIVDVVSLINFVFRSGEPSTCP
jgi:thermitase